MLIYNLRYLSRSVPECNSRNVSDRRERFQPCFSGLIPMHQPHWTLAVYTFNGNLLSINQLLPELRRRESMFHLCQAAVCHPASKLSKLILDDPVICIPHTGQRSLFGWHSRQPTPSSQSRISMGTFRKRDFFKVLPSSHLVRSRNFFRVLSSHLRAFHQTPFTTAPITLRQAYRRLKRLASPCCFVAPASFFFLLFFLSSVQTNYLRCLLFLPYLLRKTYYLSYLLR